MRVIFFLKMFKFESKFRKFKKKIRKSFSFLIQLDLKKRSSWHSDFNSVVARLPCYLSKGPLKHDLLHPYLTTFYGVRNFKNAAARRRFSFLKMFKNELKFTKCKKKKKKKRNEKKFQVSDIIVSETVEINCLCKEENTCHQQRMG